MSRTEDRRRMRRAEADGYYGGMYGAKKSDNPYKAIDSRLHWETGLERGAKERRKKRN